MKTMARLVVGKNIFSNEYTCSRGDCRKRFSREGIIVRILLQPESYGSPDVIAALCGSCSQKLSEGVIDLGAVTTTVALFEK